MEPGLELTGAITGEQRAAVAALLAQRELAPRQRERLEMVKAAWLGEDGATIARWSGRTPRRVRRWPGAFRVGGVRALAGAPIPGRPPKADAAYLAALEAAVETPPRTRGLRLDRGAAQRPPGSHDGRAPRAGLAARAAAPGPVRLRPAQAHAGAPPRAGRGRRL